jgi:hypothetical protein
MLPSQNVPTEFEMRAQRLRLTKETYLGSDKLRTWCDMEMAPVLSRKKIDLNKVLTR